MRASRGPDRAGSLAGDVHVQGVVEPVEVVEEPRDGRKLHDLRVPEVRPELGHQGVVHAAGVAGHPLGQIQGGLLAGGELAGLDPAGQGLNRLIGGSELL